MSRVLISVIMPADSVMLFLKGKLVRGWPTHPIASCPGADEIFRELPGEKGESAGAHDDYFPDGGTIVTVDPDEVKFGDYLSGVFTLQLKKKRSKKLKGILRLINIRE